MAVNKITNKQTLNRESINRANQVSTKDTKIRGNAEQSINPGKDFTKNFSVTLKDIDTSVMSHIKDVMKPRIKETNEIIKSQKIFNKKYLNQHEIVSWVNSIAFAIIQII